MNQPHTPEEEQYILDWVEANPMPDQDENGVDLGRLRENLERTPAERMQHHARVRQARKGWENARPA